MGRVQILVSEETVSAYTQIKKQLERLRQLAELSEIWLDLEDEKEEASARETKEILMELTRALFAENSREPAYKTRIRCVDSIGSSQEILAYICRRCWSRPAERERGFR